VAVADAEDPLAWEAKNRNAAAIAAAVAALFTFVGTVWRGLILSDLPRHGVLETLTRATEPGPVGQLESLRVDTFQFYDDRSVVILASSIVVAIGYLALGYALTYLASAVRARRPGLPRPIVWLPLAGAGLQALSSVLSAFGTTFGIKSFLDGDRTVDAASDIASSGVGVFAQLLGLPGALALALALVFISLNAMRVGLLTRFMGVLGIITGVLQILPFGGPLPVVQCFWMLMLSVLFLGRWPGAGTPPAWRTGKAEPWPSAAEVREQRQRAAAEARGEAYEPPEAPEPEPVASGASPAARKRKRKRK
jgi:hypothetical protein